MCNRETYGHFQRFSNRVNHFDPKYPDIELKKENRYHIVGKVVEKKRY